MLALVIMLLAPSICTPPVKVAVFQDADCGERLVSWCERGARRAFCSQPRCVKLHPALKAACAPRAAPPAAPPAAPATTPPAPASEAPVTQAPITIVIRPPPPGPEAPRTAGPAPIAAIETTPPPPTPRTQWPFWTTLAVGSATTAALGLAGLHQQTEAWDHEETADREGARGHALNADRAFARADQAEGRALALGIAAGVAALSTVVLGVIFHEP